jgi:integrase
MRDWNHRDRGAAGMAKERLKNGSIARKHGAWYWRHYVDGKQKWEKIAEISDKYRSKGDVIPLINAREIEEPREGEDSTIADFVEKEYLTWAKDNKRPATYNGYEKLWESRVKDHVGQMRLSEYRPFHASRFLGELAPNMTTASLQHVRALLSGIFAHAVADGRVDVNPIRDAKCRVNAKPSQKVEHYTTKEMRGILTVLTGRERLIMALAFIGLRPAEIIGLRWEDVTQEAISIQRSMWRGQLSDGGKSKRSRRIIPLGPFVIAILAQHQAAFPSVSGFVLENFSGTALNTSGLAKLIREKIRPAMQAHGYTWRTMYAGRRGAITEINRHTGGNTQVAAPLFGHTPEVEVKHYVRELPDATRNAAIALDSALQETNERQAVNADVEVV